MSCDLLSTGRTRGCANFVGGIKNVYFSSEDLGAITYDSTHTQQIQTLAGTPEFFKYEMEGSANTYTEAVSRIEGNGTKFYTQTLVIQLPKMDKLTRDEFEKLASDNPYVVVEDFNSQFFLCGLDNGMIMTAGGMQTGGARGDLNGYTATFTAETKLPATFLVSDLTTTTATVSSVQITP